MGYLPSYFWSLHLKRGEAPAQMFPIAPWKHCFFWAVPKLEPRGALGTLPCKVSSSGTTLLPFRSIFKQKIGFLKS